MRLIFRAALALAALAVAPVPASAQFAPPVMVADADVGGTRVTFNGLPGNWYPASGEIKHPTILMLGGSEGGLTKGSNRHALALRDRGYNVLYQSYYRTTDANADFALVPVETFDEAIAWLKQQPGVDPERLGILGSSKGAEAALLIASRHPEFKAVVATMPSNVVWEGFSFSSEQRPEYGSSWSFAGEPLPFLPFGEVQQGDSLVQLYGRGLEALSNHEDAIIPVEAITGRVLLICGEADTLWPSCDMARRVKTRADAMDGPEVEILAYADAGHAVFGSPLPADSDLSRLTYFGGSGEGNNAARKDSMAKMEAFLDEVLKD
ncbi:acyl-CoA thioester hydrolase/BAAT C-terminal domain-containing protein [Novosphingobium aquimarinum]|uniref:acyl-CoA thioester hydrolase/BAAT C-terminal domain-containing protein n=1 Tax=Novosphingobium aquimarinum TaxID=2682494 RepID=UPI0012EC5F84|nr:acyl-CoA thioester hydrolase/BAAT C-terminal domain-containing protein [Novosphingobium aquimarinum]